MPVRANTQPDTSKRRMFANVLACVAGFAVIAAVLLCCINVISKELESSLNLFMGEIAEVEGTNVNAAIDGKFSVLHGASAFVVADNIGNEPALIERFREIVESGAFTRVGVTGLDGTLVSYDADEGALPMEYCGDRDYVQAALRGDDFVTEPLEDALSHKSGVVFAVPVYDIKHEGGDPIGALVGITTIEAFTSMIDASLFEGNGYVNIIDSSGNTLFRSGRSDATARHNVLSEEHDEDGSAGLMRKNLVEGTGGSVSFTQSDGAPKSVVYRPLDVNDWFIEVVLPTDYLEAKNRTVLLASLGMAAFILTTTALLTFVLLRTRHRNSKALERTALVDGLTGLDNVLAFTRKNNAKPDHFEGDWSLVLFNLVGFSLFNTIFGYERGTEGIRATARVLSEHRGNGELLARLSGDRFLMLVRSSDASRLEAHLLDLLHGIDEAVDFGDTQYRVTSQCCVYRLSQADAQRDLNLIIQDMAVPLRHAKSSAGARVVLYDEDNVAAARRLREIEGIMSTALSKREFVAHFQPQYDIEGEEPVLCGAEALVRWNSPVLGLVRPDEFIPIFEANGFVDRIDRYMLERACIRLREWMDAGMRCVPISVNLSRRNLFSADLIDQIERTVDAHRIPHRLIKVELTESIVSESNAQLIETAVKLHERGFRVAMDDFGTGDSTLPMLKDVPFDTVKLDRTFFGDSVESQRGRIMLANVFGLLDQLGFETVAEGVETLGEVAQLKRWGCQVIQGYVFGRPVSAEDFLHDHLQPAQPHLRSEGAETPGGPLA